MCIVVDTFLPRFSYAFVFISAPNVHTILLNRAEAYLKLREFSKAYKDAQKAVRLANSWSKVNICDKVCFIFRY